MGKSHSLQSVIELTQAKILFIGKITERKAAVQDGYYIGHVNRQESRVDVEHCLGET
ncbi:hypothetical protein Lsan_1912 [Legionella santicrucis]|uniref:Uncharacterized protein n=1 Tax=Legionella santicrucis TaxID=45074 RepID=A0A0W0YVQ0_9GAMM|nr:hypothetical protein [Legionella santicrucis]KTD60907.1 hypothetical protein Lsan_1912 [Legionella santicrucis]